MSNPLPHSESDIAQTRPGMLEAGIARLRWASSLVDCGHHLAFETSPCRLRAYGSSRPPTGGCTPQPLHPRMPSPAIRGGLLLWPTAGAKPRPRGALRWVERPCGALRRVERRAARCGGLERSFRPLEVRTEACSSYAEVTDRKR